MASTNPCKMNKWKPDMMIAVLLKDQEENK